MNNLKIYVILTVVMMIWGMNVSAVKMIVEHFPPMTINSLRVFTAGIVVFILLGMMKKIRKPAKEEYLFIFFGGLLNVTCHHLFLSIGLARTSAVNSGLILGMGPLLTALLAIPFVGKRMTIVKGMGFILGGIGITLTVMGGGKGLSGMNLGDFYIFISILAQAGSFIIISKAAKSMDPRLLTGYMLIFGSAVSMLIGFWQEPEGLGSLGGGSPLLWLLFAGSAVVATAAGHMLYNYAVGMVGPAETSIFLNLSTFFSLIGAALFLGETITFAHLSGMVFIIGGVILGSGALEELMLKRRIRKQAA
ncbi:DMT family transporter [Bacillus sp. FJAT-27251]|uniref:DMT family transporter n=1 Tax=Bacillus sp. FJAT-27251 TaxID=1684142 RepID=UPI0006A7E419|nr:DMT family transporter [Bacillus sp. FJAT-27251]